MKTESQAPIGSPQNKFEASNKSSFQCFFTCLIQGRVGPMGGGGPCFLDKFSGGGGEAHHFRFYCIFIDKFFENLPGGDPLTPSPLLWALMFSSQCKLPQNNKFFKNLPGRGGGALTSQQCAAVIAVCSLKRTPPQ
jgi:hypothetical protein